MCGIFGLAVTSKSSLNKSNLIATIKKLYQLSESRGKDASGLLTKKQHKIRIVKSGIRGSELIKLPEFKSAIDDTIQTSNAISDSVLYLGHTRMVTNGSSEIHDNNQPVLRNALSCIHNGIIVNDEHLWHEHPELGRKYDVDTEIFLALIEKNYAVTKSLETAVRSAINLITGANSFALVSMEENKLVLTTTNGSLYYAIGDKQNLMIFASEKFILEQTINTNEMRGLFSQAIINQLSPQQIGLCDLESSQINVEFSQEKKGTLSQSQNNLIYKIEDSSPLRFQSTKKLITNSSSAIEQAFLINNHAIKALKRCTQCILPETFPYLQFNEQGVCTLCQIYKPLQKHGTEPLKARLDAIRKKNHEPDCLVPISGGRDSCYGLHYIKRELNLNPVAYTYDWGMVTDLARRNISRMCGELGVEHILISADIPKKLANIRLNVSAWLRQPHLGIIPLFIAGDKQFFYYANMLSTQMKLGEIIYSVNPLERTDFKVGFCNINEDHTKSTYKLSTQGKLKLLSFYSKQFMRNPGYLNRSLIDTSFSFFSYYLQAKPSISLFEYIDWTEPAVVQPLIDQYGWETAKDTKSTWRIGDGTAAFYNYIYLRVAGFTENDTFRSNQIREGLMSRHEALSMIEDENVPRAETFGWYCDKIGINAVDAIKTINRIPLRYLA